MLNTVAEVNDVAS